jgi:lysozyme
VTTRTVNQAGIDLLKQSEGVRLHAYPDPGSGGDPWTIGYGHTGPDVKKGLVINQSQADNLLVKDLEKFCAGVVACTNRPLNDNQFSALVCFAYNVGLGNLRSSTLLKCINAGNLADAAKEFSKWTKASGKILPGLVIRREKESELFSRM